MYEDNAFIVLYSRRFSRPIAKFLATHTQVTANQVTVSSLLVYFIASYLLFTGIPVNVSLAGLMIYLALIVDMVDGDLARMRNKPSLKGKWLDVMIGEFGTLLYMVAVGFGLFHQTGELWSLYLLIYFLFAKFIDASVVLNTQAQIGGYEAFKNYALDPLKNNLNRLVSFLLSPFVRKQSKEVSIHYNFQKKLPSLGIYVMVPTIGLIFNQLALVMLFFCFTYTLTYIMVFSQLFTSLDKSN